MLINGAKEVSPSLLVQSSGLNHLQIDACDYIKDRDRNDLGNGERMFGRRTFRALESSPVPWAKTILRRQR